MKHIIGTLVLVLVINGVSNGAQTSRPNHSELNSQHSVVLERAIEMIFLKCIREREGEKNDRKESLEQLGSREEVTAVLRKMIARHRYAREGSMRLIYLNGATWMLGEFGDKEAESGLSSLVFDRRVHENVRAQAMKSLGDIDPETSKELLLRALRSDSQYYMIRVYAAEGLAKVRDPRAVAALEKAARRESDSYVRDKFRAAARQARSIH